MHLQNTFVIRPQSRILTSHDQCSGIHDPKLKTRKEVHRLRGSTRHRPGRRSLHKDSHHERPETATVCLTWALPPDESIGEYRSSADGDATDTPT